MIPEFLVYLSALITVIITSLLFFKYISPKEKKDLRDHRDRLFKDVEKLLKKENFLEVVEAFDKIAEISEKLGELGVSDEFHERANVIRRKLGQEVKSSTSASLEDVTAFIQLLIQGPYGATQAVEAVQAVPQAVPAATETKSLIEEGEEILARLARIKGEEVVEPALPSAAASPPPMPTGAPVAATPPPMAPPSASSPPRGPPVAATPPPMAPPIASPPPPKAPPSAIPSPPIGNPIAAPPPAAIPSPPTPFPVAKSSPPFAPEAPSAAVSSPVPTAIPISESSTPDLISEIDEPQVQILDEPDVQGLEEPQVQGLEGFTATEPEIKTDRKKKKPSKKDEKAEILNRLAQQLPSLPEKMKKNIVKELLKRPKGKLRETWFKVYVHKNKQYAEPK